MSDKQYGLGDAPIEDEYHRKMNALARRLDEWFNREAREKDRKVGFCLMVFDFGMAPAAPTTSRTPIARTSSRC